MKDLNKGNLFYLERNEGPEFVSEALRLGKGFLALGRLAQRDNPKKRILRVFHRETDWYLMRYTSKTGFGLDMYARVMLWHEECNWALMER